MRGEIHPYKESEKMKEISNEKRIAMTTFDQLSGGKPGRLMAMIGAKHLTYDKDGTLIFKFMRGNQSINAVKIKLTVMDLYDMEFFNVRGRLIEKFKGVYCDQMRDIFERVTGLYTSLGTLGA